MEISVRGWKITDEAVEETVRELKELVPTMDEKRMAKVYQLFDNVSYLVKKLGGSRVLPEKGKDGKYHVVGKLDNINTEEIKRMVRLPSLYSGLVANAGRSFSPWQADTDTILAATLQDTAAM
jgi:hypothetical protein